MPAGAELRAEGGATGRQWTHHPIQPGQKQLAIQRHQQRLAVGAPFIGDDALQVADPGPLALHLLGLGEGPPAGELQRIDQHAPFALLAVIAPQVVALAVIRAVAQQGQPMAIGRKAPPPRGRAVDAGAGIDPLESECGWRGFRNAHAGTLLWLGSAPRPRPRTAKGHRRQTGGKCPSRQVHSRQGGNWHGTVSAPRVTRGA